MSHGRILVVEDRPPLRRLLVRALEQEGYEVVSAEDGAAGIRQVQEKPFDLVLTDLKLPRASGLEVLRAASAAQANTPVVVLTAYGTVETAVEAMKAGAVDFIEKPFNDELLLESIRNALTLDVEQRATQAERAEIAARLAHLTPREHEVMEMVTNGRANKEIALTLGVSAKTVEAHRARVMEKMQAASLAELVKMAIAAGIAKR